MYYDSREDGMEAGENTNRELSDKPDFGYIEQQNKMTCTEQMNEAETVPDICRRENIVWKAKGKEVSLYMLIWETREQTEPDTIQGEKKAYVRYSTSSYDSVPVGGITIIFIVRTWQFRERVGKCSRC